MVETFCTSGSVKLKAGTNVPVLTPAQYTELINQAEAALNVEAKNVGYNFLTNYSSLSGSVKLILEDGASSHAAVSAIAFDPSGYTTVGEAAFISNVNWTRYLEVVRKLKDKQYTDFIRGF